MIALLRLVSPSRLQQLSISLLVIVVGYFAVGSLGGVAEAVFVLHLLVPLFIYGVFNLRFWRGVAPLVLIVAFAARLGWTIAVTGWTGLGLTTEALWLARIAGFLIGAFVGYRALQSLGRRFLNGRISDQELFLNSWYFIFAVIQSVVFVLVTKNLIFFLTLLAFPVFILVKRALLQIVLVKRPPRPLRLMFLRVFAEGAPAERFFDHLTEPWRRIGSIDLLAGRDLALRNIEPSDFAAFLSGQLSARYIANVDNSSDAADEKMTPAPDGRYPLRQFFCLADTWQPVMRSRVDRSDAIVMDLRGFTSDRYGCRIELAYLSCAAPNKPVLLVVDEKTNLDLIKTIVGAPVGTVAAKPDWLVVFASMQQRVRRFGTFRHLAHLIDASELRNHLSLPRILSRPGSAATFLPKLVATVAVRSRRVPQKSSTY